MKRARFRSLSFVSEKDVLKTMSPREANRLMAICFKKLKDPGAVQMPEKIYLNLPEGDFRAMPVFTRLVGGAAGIKWISVFPDNPSRALPSVIGTLLMNDIRTGRLSAIFEANTITALRTGAAGALASKLLGRSDSRTFALIGAGAQAEFQLRCHSEYFDFNKILVWSPNKEEGRRFVKRLSRGFPALVFETDLERCIRPADIISTCTPSRRPLVKSLWVMPGTHINAIGADAPGKRELETMLLKRSRIFVDDREQALHSGEMNVPVSERELGRKDIAGTLTEVAQKKKGRRSKSDITVFDSTGLAIQDILLASAILKKLNRREARKP